LARLTRNPEIVAREIDDTVFLVGTDNDSVFHLNTIGAAIWRLLAEPVSEAETTQTLVDAFPDIPAEQVRDDVEKLFRKLDARGFLVSID
jgi:hypothetical protein